MSSRKNTLKQFTVISAEAMENTDTIVSGVTNINYLDNIGYQFDWTGSPTGSFQIQVSANYNQDAEGNVISVGTWVPATVNYFNGSSTVTALSIPTSVGTPIYVDCNQLSAPWVRTVYTNASGNGVLTAVVTGKMI